MSALLADTAFGKDGAERLRARIASEMDELARDAVKAAKTEGEVKVKAKQPVTTMV